MPMRPRSCWRALIVTGAAACLLPAGAFAQAPAQQTPPSGPELAEPIEPAPTSRGVAAFDVLVLRPLGFAALPVGVALFIPAALTTAPNGVESVQTALEFFVTNPANYVFKRPLGEF
jgi:hypothetical protein